MRKAQARFALRQKVQEAVAELVLDDIPDAMVSGEMQNRLEDLAQRLAQQGISLDQYVAMTGRSAEEITSELREGATLSVKTDLALRALVAAEGHDGLSVSVGVATTEGGEASPLRLREAADGALYEAKRRGRDRVITASGPALTMPGA